MGSLPNFVAAPHMDAFWEGKDKKEILKNDEFEWFEKFGPEGYTIKVREQPPSTMVCRIFAALAMTDYHLALFHKEVDYHCPDPGSLEMFRLGGIPVAPSPRQTATFIEDGRVKMKEETVMLIWERSTKNGKYQLGKPKIKASFLKKFLLDMGPFGASILVDDGWRDHKNTGNLQAVPRSTEKIKEKPKIHSVVITGWRKQGREVQFIARDNRPDEWGFNGAAYVPADRFPGYYELMVFEPKSLETPGQAEPPKETQGQQKKNFIQKRLAALRSTKGSSSSKQ